METRKYTPGDSDITVDLNSGVFRTEDSQELAESLRAETDLRVESGLFDYYSEGDPFPPEVILAIVYTLFPLKEIDANVRRCFWRRRKPPVPESRVCVRERFSWSVRRMRMAER